MTAVASSRKRGITTANIQRVDFELDGRPQRSDDVAHGTRTVDLALAHGALMLRGYKSGELAAARRVAF